jgi:hypothetical protein
MMSFHRTVKLGIFGALLALAAVPTVANATPTVYTNFGTWDSSVVGSVKEYTTLCTVQYAPPGACATPDPDLSVVSTVPLRSGVTLNVVAPPMKKNIVGTDWTSFWPPGLTTGTPYAGDILVSKPSNSNGLITSIALTLSSPLTDFGFVALPADSGNPYDLTVTLLDKNGNFITQEDANIGPGNSCSQGTIAGDPVGTPAPCGFFGYTGGQSVYGVDLSINNAACPSNNFARNQSVVINNAQVSCNGGMAIGDFVVGQVAPAPEPASLAILGAGLFGLGAVRRRLKS